MCYLTFSSCLGGLKRLQVKFRPGKAGSNQYKRGTFYETFSMQSQEITYEEFITLPGSRKNGTKFHPGQPRSCNHHLREVTGNRVSDHYCEKHLFKGLSKIAVPWTLVPTKRAYQNF